MLLILSLIAFPGIIVFADFIGFLIKGRRIVGKIFISIAELGSLIILPLMYADFTSKNVCCADEIDTATFSPHHQLTIGILMLLCLASYFYSKFRKEMTTPVLEVLINSFILMGVILGIVLFFHTTETFYAIFGSLPVILLGILMLAKNHKLFIEFSENKKLPHNKFQAAAMNILSARPFIKFPILLVVCLPVLMILITILLLFGQKPDSVIRAFTDTYKHGLSQWDYKCADVSCGGHYLCSVAANGHKQLVKPIRMGVRNGKPITCNRQLLVSNAFEDLIQEKAPALHKAVRRSYNRVGNFIHRHYWIFKIRLVSDFVYVFMKPFEWFFLAALYTLDKSPENRIAKQYLSKEDRLRIDTLEKVTGMR